MAQQKDELLGDDGITSWKILRHVIREVTYEELQDRCRKLEAKNEKLEDTIRRLNNDVSCGIMEVTRLQNRCSSLKLEKELVDKENAGLRKTINTERFTVRDLCLLLILTLGLVVNVLWEVLMKT